MNLELMKLKRDHARVYAAKLEQEIAIEELAIKMESLKKSVKISEETIQKLEKQMHDLGVEDA